MTYQTLDVRLDRAKNTDAYRHYLTSRESVLRMLDEAERNSDGVSEYWTEELAGFNYILDASPLIVDRLREHSHHITGIRSYESRQHHDFRKTGFLKKFIALKELDHANLFVQESTILGGFGHDQDVRFVNLDTLKFYEYLIGLDSQGFLDEFKYSPENRGVVAEVGPGWGGFPYQFKTLFPNTTYVLIDLPLTLLLSITYLKTAFSDASVFVYGDYPIDELPSQLETYDFVFIPHYALDQLELPGLGLTLNMVSFQEMTSIHVEDYVKRAFDWGSPHIYSLNRDRSRYNSELSSVSSIMAKYYETTDVNVLPVPYTDLALPNPLAKEIPTIMSRIKHPRRTLRSVKRKINPPPGKAVNMAQEIHKYKHVAGRRKTDTI